MIRKYLTLKLLRMNSKIIINVSKDWTKMGIFCPESLIDCNTIFNFVDNFNNKIYIQKNGKITFITNFLFCCMCNNKYVSHWILTYMNKISNKHFHISIHNYDLLTRKIISNTNKSSPFTWIFRRFVLS